MAKLKCKDHKRRVQVSGYGTEPYIRVLHRSDRTRCDSEELVSYDNVFTPLLVMYSFDKAFNMRDPMNLKRSKPSDA